MRAARRGQQRRREAAEEEARRTERPAEERVHTSRSPAEGTGGEKEYIHVLNSLVY